MTRDSSVARPSGTSSSDAPAAAALLETKLYLPKARSGLVSRPRLIERLREGAGRKLTVVTAPPGFGKTTLLAEWLEKETAKKKSAAWVSLDTNDNEPTIFWAYVIAALQKAHPGVGKAAMTQLYSARTVPTESMLGGLINEVVGTSGDTILVLDDYHVIDESAIHNMVAFLLDHLPPRMHVVIASRSEPSLPLARLRAKGDLAELSLADLRFTTSEASDFLNKLMALGLSPGDVSKLEERTEGWIAGLKLAALSLKGREDVRQFVEGFSGDNRFIADYLVEEVLQAEPERTRRFLLTTSILDRLSGPLCDAVTGETGSQGLLESLERRNLFVVPLDDRREWYRYHHLFAEVLQAHANRENPDVVRAAHQRAGAWYEASGSPAHAVRHAIAAKDMDRALALLEKAWPEKNRSYETTRWLKRMKTLPDELIRARPVLSMAYAWALLNAGEVDAVETWLQQVEKWLSAGDEIKNAVVIDHDRFRTLPTELASARVYLAQSRGALAGMVEQAQRSLESVPEGDHSARATGTALLALSLWGRGDLEAAHRTFTEALALMRAAGQEFDVARGIFVLGDIRACQGRLHEAVAIYEGGLESARELATSVAGLEIDDLYVGLSDVHREWGNLDTAEDLLRTVTQESSSATYRGNRERWCTSMARIRAARGDLKGALALLNEAEGAEWLTPMPRLRPVPAMKARLAIAQGLAPQPLSKGEGAREEELTFLTEFKHLTDARVLIARREFEEAKRLLGRLLADAEKGGRLGSVIESLLLHALALHASGDTRAAFPLIERALGLAEAEGFLRVFVDEGPRMRDLLRQAAARGIGGEQARRVLAGFEDKAPAAATASGGPALTTRELEILRLIAAGMRNQEIADQLSISPATVKRHIANAYTKLGAGHRTEALARAKELNLI